MECTKKALFLLLEILNDNILKFWVFDKLLRGRSNKMISTLKTIKRQMKPIRICLKGVGKSVLLIIYLLIICLYA